MRDRVRFQRPIADEGLDGAGSGEWEPVCECWAEVQDVIPSRRDRGENLSNGVTMASRTARVRLAYRAGLNAGMRLLVGRNLRGDDGQPYWHTDRIMQIITEPAVLGRRDGLELMAEEYRPAGNPA